jgi:hypothetical protein
MPVLRSRLQDLLMARKLWAHQFEAADTPREKVVVSSFGTKVYYIAKLYQ